MKHYSTLKIVLVGLLISFATPALWAADGKPMMPVSSSDKLKKLVESKALEKRLVNGSVRYRVGGNSGGGGHPFGIELKRLMIQALDGMKKKMPETYASFAPLSLNEYVDTVEVTVINEPMDVEAEFFTQDSPAANFPDSNSVVLSESRWKALRGQDDVKEGIALHELLSLKHKESTGNYHYSARYLALLRAGRSGQQSAFNGNRIEQLRSISPNATPLEILATFYDEADQPINMYVIRDLAKLEQLTCVRVSFDGESGVEEAPRSEKLLVLGSGKNKRGHISDSTEEFGALLSGVMTHSQVEPDLWFSIGYGDITSVARWSLKKSPNEVLQERVANESFQKTQVTTSVRKNAGMIAFKEVVTRTFEGLSASTKVEQSYGYCFTK